MKRWLVTGGVGFVGFHLTRALCSRGATVRILDDFSDAPYPTAYKIRNERDLLAEFGDHVAVTRGCVTDRSVVDPLLREVDGVIHLAGLAGVRPSFAAPDRYASVNVLGTTVVFQAAQEAKVETFLFASSSSVYGDSTPLPADEDAPAICPESPYAASKRAAELLLAAMSKKTPTLRCTALRFFTVYGARQRPEMAITSFARAITAKRTITLFGDGTMQRDFTHVDDIVRGIVASADHAPQGFRAYNLGSGSPVTLTYLLSAMEVASNQRARVEYGPVPRGDVESTFARIDRAHRELGWTPQIALEEGLRSVFDWVAQNP